jgi:tRNA acetyltransferase TAN1
LSSRFDLIVTHEPGPYNYRYVLSILRDVLGDFRVVDASYSVVLIHTGDPYRAVEKIRESGINPGVIYRVIPVDRVIDPYVEVVAEEASKLADERIPSDKSYRVSLRGRLYWRETRLPAHTMDAIRVIAEKIKRRVSLENPDYVVYIRSIKFYHRRRFASLTVTETRNILSFKSSRV